MTQTPKLRAHEIHVWKIRLPSAEHCADALREVLSPAERSRADRYRTADLRMAFVARRASLRLLLGQYSSCDSKAIVFERTGDEKPYLARPAGGAVFNVSHSSGLALLAFARKCEVGVDVEHVRPMRAMDSIAGRFFAEDEIDRLRTLAECDREVAFFRALTRKEAFVKATGQGLSAGLDSFAVTLLPDEEPRLLYVHNDPDRAVSWKLHDLDVGPGYMAALAYEGSVRSVLQFTVSDPADLF